ncbi:type II CAAX prenyl endopeptidase Rce1 family protein [Dactylosporangium sucinum]|uniref:CAAX prenyl protease 2/Lysostaphin resistance protein A-like domain-containing protein n=1 Tax=Dactylosporangium sucinum TaxID=1424081 RepID=A0A917UBY3_9ACTN|nr:CPBP family intramembrane glutamic endopeptidase [Dactylosporangium sucinum]GGM78495.1 hypothetical protein GCM10007977_095060 [Dactylosporangium sucinum]
MTSDGAWFAGAALAAAAIWLFVFRLAVFNYRTNRRVRIWVVTHTSVPGKYVIPILGTLVYLALGVLGSIALLYVGDLSLGGLLAWHVTPHGVGLMLFTAAGAHLLTGFMTSIMYAVRPRIDVPTAISRVRWINEILVLPRPWRYATPAISAAVEEFFFRGVILGGLLATGTPAWAAIAISGASFIILQVLYTDTALQATVIGLGCVVLSVLCGLLVVAEGSVLPAIAVHASFAVYYTRSSVRRAARVLTALPR